MKKEVKEKETNNESNKVIVVNNNKKNPKIIILISIVIIVMLVIIIKNIIYSEPNRIKMNAKNSIEKVVESSELRTVTYTYNAIAKKCEGECSDKKNDDYLYFVSYKGTVTAGIDFEYVTFEVDKENKKLIITVPEAKITSYNIDIGKNKYIFKDEKYNNASELNSAHDICEKDLKDRTSKDELILKTAKENAQVVLKQFYEPWLKNYYKNYTLEVK